MKRIAGLVLSILVFTSCEKVVDLNYKDNESKIIIEGNITDQPGPYFVRITKSLSLADTGDYPAIDNAVVSISDNDGNSETLIAQGNGMYRTRMLAGLPGRTYSLLVTIANKTYSAESTMPEPVRFDSIKVEEFTFAGEIERNIIPVYRDPIGKNNNYRFVLSINNKLINQHFVQHDEVTNGVVNTQRLETDDNLVELEAGDLLTLQMQCVDRKVASYYTTLALMNDSGPGGGTTPNNPPGNISNGALGLFSAHTFQEKMKVLK